jgi:hypothetical protein
LFVQQRMIDVSATGSEPVNFMNQSTCQCPANGRGLTAIPR